MQDLFEDFVRGQYARSSWQQKGKEVLPDQLLTSPLGIKPELITSHG